MPPPSSHQIRSCGNLLASRPETGIAPRERSDQTPSVANILESPLSFETTYGSIATFNRQDHVPTPLEPDERQASFSILPKLASASVLGGLAFIEERVDNAYLKKLLRKVQNSYIREAEFYRARFTELTKEAADNLLGTRIQGSIEAICAGGVNDKNNIRFLEAELSKALRRCDSLQENLDQQSLLKGIKVPHMRHQSTGVDYVKEEFPTLMDRISGLWALSRREDIFVQAKISDIDKCVYDLLGCLLGNRDSKILENYLSNAIQDCATALCVVQAMLAMTISCWVFEVPIYEMERSKGILNEAYRNHLRGLGDSFLARLDLLAHQDTVQSDEWHKTYTEPRAAVLAQAFLNMLSPLFGYVPAAPDTEQSSAWHEWMGEKGFLESIYRDALRIRAESVVGTHTFRSVWYPTGTSVDLGTMSVEETFPCAAADCLAGGRVKLCMRPALVCFKGGKEVCDQKSFLGDEELEKSDFEILSKAVIQVGARDLPKRPQLQDIEGASGNASQTSDSADLTRLLGSDATLIEPIARNAAAEEPDGNLEDQQKVVEGSVPEAHSPRIEQNGKPESRKRSRVDRRHGRRFCLSDSEWDPQEDNKGTGARGPKPKRARVTRPAGVSKSRKPHIRSHGVENDVNHEK